MMHKDDGVETFYEHEVYHMYDCYLDDRYGMTLIAGLDYDTSVALKHVNKRHYENHFDKWLETSGLQLIEVNGVIKTWAFKSQLAKRMEQKQDG